MPAFTLTNRAALRRAFYRLTGTAATDDALTEHDSEVLEAVHYHLQRGLWSAQEYLISVGTTRWLTRADATPWVADGDLTYLALPDDFLRLSGDERVSPFLVNNTRRTLGVSSNFDNGLSIGASYWVEGDRLYAGKGVTAPTGLQVEYIHRHPLVTSDDENAAGGAIDFPVEDRPLIVAFAAAHAMVESWLPGGPDMEAKIDRNLAMAKAESARRSRRTREPRKMRPPEVLGTRWWL